MELKATLLVKGVWPRSMVGALSEVCSPILKGRQLRIHCRDSEWSFKKRISVIRLTVTRMGQLERKWDLITKM